MVPFPSSATDKGVTGPCFINISIERPQLPLPESHSVAESE